MVSTGKVFISHAHEDNDKCAPLLAALTAWGVEYWFDTERLEAGQYLTSRLQNAIEAADTFIKIGTAASQRSWWVTQETGAFLTLTGDDHKIGINKRVLILIVFDSFYKPELFERTAIYINAYNQPPEKWLDELKRALRVQQQSTPRQVPPIVPPVERGHSPISPSPSVQAPQALPPVERFLSSTQASQALPSIERFLSSASESNPGKYPLLSRSGPNASHITTSSINEQSELGRSNANVSTSIGGSRFRANHPSVLGRVMHTAVLNYSALVLIIFISNAQFLGISAFQECHLTSYGTSCSLSSPALFLSIAIGVLFGLPALIIFLRTLKFAFVAAGKSNEGGWGWILLLIASLVFSAVFVLLIPLIVLFFFGLFGPATDKVEELPPVKLPTNL